ncbi:MAG: MBL fold metallo-hydrolase [Clostridia bacterium]
MAEKRNSRSKNSSSKKQQSVSIKLTKATAIALIVVILIVAIACITLYFGFPDTWAKFVLFFGDKNTVQTEGTLPSGAMQFADGDLSVHYIDIGQGDCVYIMFPDKRDMLIDCGKTSSDFPYQKTLDYLNLYVTDGELDFLMLTHTDQDHVGYLDDVLRDYDVNTIFMPNVKAEPTNAELSAQIAALPAEKLDIFTDKDTISTATYANFFIAALTEPNCEVFVNMDKDANTNNVKISGQNFDFTFYCPTADYLKNSDLSNAKKINAVSPIGILEYNGFRLVFTGDSNEINEPMFVDRVGFLNCDVLKVGHHGSDSSSTESFLDAIDCEYAVFCCNAKGNSNRHPRQVVIDRLLSRNAEILRTDNNGTIVLVVNQKMQFYTQRKLDKTANQIGLK